MWMGAVWERRKGAITLISLKIKAKFALNFFLLSKSDFWQITEKFISKAFRERRFDVCGRIWDAN